jgi:hypothetical protein
MTNGSGHPRGAGKKKTPKTKRHSQPKGPKPAPETGKTALRGGRRGS